jgi:predicted membrane protein
MLAALGFILAILGLLGLLKVLSIGLVISVVLLLVGVALLFPWGRGGAPLIR